MEWTPPLLQPASFFLFSKNISGVSHERKKEPTVVDIIGITDIFFKEHLRGEITKKGKWLDTIIPVTIIGECGVMYLYSDGSERFSEPGKHYIVLRENSNVFEKIPTAKITLIIVKSV